MREELSEIVGIAKREGVKSIVVTAAIIALAVMSYKHFSGDEVSEEVSETTTSTNPSRKIASISDQTFKRKVPSIEIPKIEKKEEKEEDAEDFFDPEEARLNRADKEEESSLNARSTSPLTTEESAEVFKEEYVEDSNQDFSDDSVSSSDDTSDPVVETGGGTGAGCVGSSCPETCEINNSCGDDDEDEQEEEVSDGGGLPSDPIEDNSVACTPSMIVFPDHGPGTYSANPTVSLSSPDSKDIYYCITSIPGSCNPEPSIDGLPYSSSFDIGTSDGNYILSFLANEDDCAKRYTYSYEVDSTKPDVQVSFTAGQYLQTNERIEYAMNSSQSGSTSHYFWLLKLGGATEFSDCKTMAESFSLGSFGLDLMLSDSSPDETDLNSITIPYNLEYSTKSLLSYGKTGSQLVSIVSDRSSGSPSSYQYGCQMNQVFLMDFPAFDFKATYSHDINVNGELEFSGNFNSYDAGRYPASGNESYLEIGFENIVN